MPSFQDTQGKQWDIFITGAGVKRLLDLLGVDIGRPFEAMAGKDQPLLTSLYLDVAFLVDVIYVLCKPAADAAGLSDVQFAERLDGASLEAASEAFMEALVNFFQSRRRPEVVRAIRLEQEAIRKAVNVGAKVVDKINFEARLDELEGTLDQEAQKLLTQAMSELLGKHAASSQPLPE